MSDDNVYTMTTVELWNRFNILAREMNEYELLKKVMYGIKVKYPIFNLINEWFELHPNQRAVLVNGWGKHHLTDFMVDKDLRELEMRQFIIEHDENQKVERPRV